MKSMAKPFRLVSFICALVFSLCLANTCKAGFANPILGDGNAYMLSAASGAWDKVFTGQLNLEGVADPVFRFAEWPGAAPGLEAISLADFLSLWGKGATFQDIALLGTLSIVNGDGKKEYKVLIRDVEGKADGALVSVAIDFGDASRPADFGEATLIIKDWHGPAEEAVQLNLITQGLEAAQRIVIFQENLADESIDSVVAWSAHPGCQQCMRVIEIRAAMSISACDVYGNYISPVIAEHGQFFSYLMDAYSGPYLTHTGSASDPSLLQVENDDTHGPIDIWVYRSGKLLAFDSIIASGQMVSFSFDQAIYFGVASNVDQGTSIPLSDISSLVKIPLANIKSADLRMSGNQSAGFTFSLENVEWR